MDGDGKAQSWDYFIRNRKKVRDYLESKVSNREDVADLLQDVGIIILGHDDPPLDAERFVPWCMGIARNTVLHHWRHARRYDRVFSASDATGCDWGLASSFEGALLDRQLIATVLHDLDESSRTLLLLRYVAGKTSREIAEDLGQSPAAVRMRIMRVCELLRERGRVARVIPFPGG